MTRGDAAVVVAALAVAALVWAGFYMAPGRGEVQNAVVRVDGKEIARMPVTSRELARKEIRLSGGAAVIEFGQGKVRIVPPSAGFCPDGTCWKTGWISRNGQSIVCVPNHMTITLEGSARGVDSVVR